ncbi:MAG: NAD(P)H-hydrate dehydratase [Clostridiales bacterium]|nr:NAD(P)H-hydrate dehydratase [Clostridiales bacterium]
MVRVTNDLVRDMCPQRDEKGHKGTFGTVLVTAGSGTMSGALCLCTGAALRSGAGLVRTFTRRGALLATRINLPCALLSAFEEDRSLNLKEGRKLLLKAASAAIGPGIDTEDKRYADILELYIREAKNLVIDAGAITILSKNREFYFPLLKEREVPVVLTPHIGEFKRLSGKETDLEAEALKMAEEINAVIVLKSSTTFIASPDGESYIVDNENSGMAKGGSGDVLTGLTAGLLAQGMSPINAAISAVRIHSNCGILAREKYGERAMLPSDLPEFLPESYKMAGWK